MTKHGMTRWLMMVAVCLAVLSANVRCSEGQPTGAEGQSPPSASEGDVTERVVLRGHTRMVYTAEFTADGTRVAGKSPSCTDTRPWEPWPRSAPTEKSSS